MTTQYADVSSRALRLTTIRGSEDLSSLDPIKHAQLTWSVGDQQLIVKVGILGASHYMVVSEAGTPVLTEVFACTDKVPGWRDKHRGIALGRDGTIGPLLAAILELSCRYEFSARTASYTREVTEELTRLNDGPHYGGSQASVKLRFDFPGTSDAVVADHTAAFDPESTQPAATVVVLEIGEQGVLRLRTAHSYPNEGVVVFTSTTLKGV